MENNIPTAEETRLKYIPNGCVNIKGKGLGDGKPQKKYEDNLLDQMLLEFAKLHVEKIKDLQQSKYYAGETGYIKKEEWEELLTNIK
jgi:hypothetical protein